MPPDFQQTAVFAAADRNYTTPASVRELWREAAVRRFTGPSGRQDWLVTGKTQVSAVLADPRFSRAEARRLGAVIGPAAVFQKPGINDLDPPEHTRLRRLLAGTFSARRIRALRPRIQQITDELIAELLACAPPADLMPGLCTPLPLAAICEVLGIPYEDRVSFGGWAERVTATEVYTQDEALAALNALVSYMADLIAAKRKVPDESLLQELITARDERGRLSEDELVTLGCGLLLAGNQSTATMLGKGIVALLDHPEQLAALRADPALLPSAVDEALRYATLGVRPYGGHIRATTCDVELDGVTIPAHSVVIVSLPAANFDPAVFPEPGRFDLARENAADHLTFGYGMHRCLGAQLARMELQVAFASVLAAFPALRLTLPAEELAYTQGFLITGLGELPVTWGRSTSKEMK